MKTYALGLLAVAALAGCSPNPANHESTPVPIQTTRGEVLCQLYTPNIVLWDRAIDRPDGMSIQDADTVCQAAGWRQKKGEPI